jgi:hypothetical protein
MKPWQFIFGLGSLLVALAGTYAADREFDEAVEKRMVRYKRIEAAHQELASERAKLTMQLQGVAEQLTITKQQLAASNVQANQLNNNLVLLQNQLGNMLAQLDALAQSKTTSVVQLQLVQNQIQVVRTQINVGNTGLAQLNIAIATLTQRAAGLTNQAAGLQKTMQGLAQKLDQQLLDYAELADTYGKLSRAEQEAALPEFENWVKSDAENWGARFARAMAYRKLEKHDDAAADIAAVVEAQSTITPLALALRGEMSVARGKDKEGLADLAQANKLDKRSADVYLMRALANCRLKKFQAAEADFKFALRADKTNVEALRYLALLHAACEVASVRDGKQALDFAKKAAEASKFTDWSCLDVLAAAHAEAGDYEVAARTAAEAAELTFGENRETCLARAKQYEARQPLRIKWNVAK